MATGIVSIGADDFGAHSISVPLLAAAAAGFVVLCLLFLVRMWRFPEEIWADTARPERAFGFFTFVAGCNVLGIRLHAAGLVGVADGLAVAGGLAWLLLACSSRGGAGRLAIDRRRPDALPVGFRDLVVPLPDPAHGMAVPEACRAGLRADAVEHGLPLGMYAVATHAFGRAAGLPLLPGIARTEFWLALAAWAAVAAWMVISWFAPRWPSGPQASAAVASGG